MEVDEVADLLNEIFLLDIEWDFHEEGRPISTNTLIAFQELCRELAKRLLIREFHAAIWFLSQARYFVRGELPINELFAPLDLSVDQRERIAAALGTTDEQHLRDLEKLQTRGRRLRELFGSEDSEAIFSAFLKAEQAHLRRAGLNQRSVAIIENRLGFYKEAIIRNLIADRSILQNSLTRNIASLEGLATPPAAIYGNGSKAAAAQSSGRGRLVRAKDKVIGMATLWADALPVMTGASLDLASLASTVAGATVAAVLPRTAQDADE
jgi:hypothetical protein